MSATGLLKCLWRFLVRAVVLYVRLVAVLMVGFGIAWLMISDGLDHLAGEERRVAQGAIVQAKRHCFSTPILVRGLVPKIQVLAVVPDPTCPLSLRQRFSGQTQNYRVSLRAYTFFGVPVRRLASECGAVACHISDDAPPAKSSVPEEEGPDTAPPLPQV